jgi:hypothetical protein
MVVQDNLTKKAEEVAALLMEKTGDKWEVIRVRKVNLSYTGVKRTKAPNGGDSVPSYPVVEDLPAEENAREILKKEGEIYPLPMFSEESVTSLNNLRLDIVNMSKNEELLNEIPHYLICDDLAVVTRQIVYEDEDKAASFLVKKSHIEAAGMTKEELFARARENTLANYPVKYSSPEDLQKFFSDSYGVPVESVMMPPFAKIQMGEAPVNGARIMAFPELILERIEEDCYILPSSLHEVLLLPRSIGDMIPLFDMVGEINREVLDTEDFLSDNIYLASKAEGVVRPLTDVERVRFALMAG